MNHLDPSPEQIAQVMADVESNDGPIRMINLLKFRDVADYGDLPDPAGDDGPSTGAEAYALYGSLAFPQVEAVGGTQFYGAAVHQTVIGPDDEDWDMVVIVEYAKRASFLEMVATPAYQACAHHRTAALENSRLIMTTGW